MLGVKLTHKICSLFLGISNFFTIFNLQMSVVFQHLIIYLFIFFIFIFYLFIFFFFWADQCYDLKDMDFDWQLLE